MNRITASEATYVRKHWQATHWYYKQRCIQEGKGICDFIIAMLELKRDAKDLPTNDEEYGQFQCNKEYSDLAADMYCDFADQLRSFDPDDLAIKRELIERALTDQTIFDKADILFQAQQYFNPEETDVCEYASYVFTDDKNLDAIIELIYYMYQVSQATRLWNEDKQ